MDWKWIGKIVGFAILAIFFIMFIFFLTGCSAETTTLETEDISMHFVGEFYDNTGIPWLTITGQKFNISPNKVKEYSYDSSGSWISQWVMSSVMSIDVDGKSIDTCGSTVLIYDNRLTKYDCDIPDVVSREANSGDSSITAPKDYSAYEYFTLQYWWWVRDQRNTDCGSKLVIVMSQEGAPICMFSGDNVSWSVSKNLPKTTEVNIDGMMLYLHRCNFSIIDTAIFGEEVSN